MPRQDLLINELTGIQPNVTNLSITPVSWYSFDLTVGFSPQRWVFAGIVDWRKAWMKGAIAFDELDWQEPNRFGLISPMVACHQRKNQTYQPDGDFHDDLTRWGLLVKCLSSSQSTKILISRIRSHKMLPIETKE